MDKWFLEVSNAELIQYFERAISELTQFGLLKISEQKTAKCDDNVAYEQYCVGSTIHRGAHHPSPVYDVIVGNTKRGRVVAQPKNRNNISHRYLYNPEKRLYQIESIHQERVGHTETLFRCGNEVIGVTVDWNGVLAAVSKEVYQDNRIISFALMNCYDIGQGSHCFQYHEERYDYDPEGLCGCRFITFTPGCEYFTNEYYEFERCNGYLTSYVVHHKKQSQSADVRYKVYKARKA